MRLFYDIYNTKRFNMNERNEEKELAYNYEDVQLLLFQSYKMFEGIDVTMSVNYVMPKPTYTQHEHINFDFKYGVIHLLTHPEVRNGLFVGFGTLDHKPILSRVEQYEKTVLEKLQKATTELTAREIPFTINKDCTINVKYSFTTTDIDTKMVYSVNVKLFLK